jgi:hypothetical protein
LLKRSIKSYFFPSFVAFQGLKKLEPPILIAIITDIQVMTANQSKADPAMGKFLIVISIPSINET